MLVSTMDHVSYSYYPVPKEGGYVDLSMHPHQRDAYAYGGPSPPPPHHGHPVTNTPEETSPKNGTKSSLYKTELCKRFSEFGSCRYGAKCQFAHGVNELRHVVRHPKYKTTKCKSYWGSGHCPYGSRCRFIHDESEALLAQAHQFGPPAHAGLAATSSSPNLYLHDPKQDPMALSMNSYQESYAPPPPSYLAPFERNAWASRSHPKLSLQKSMGDGQEHSDSGSSSPGTIGHTNSLQNMPLTDAGVSDPEGYPDFKDAIDALMKFSIDSDETEEKSGSKEELWKSFSGKDEAWSLTELNLDATPFEDKDKEKKSESPRLSVFERFH